MAPVSLTFEILDVTPAGIPGNAILAAAVVNDIPPTGGGDVRLVVATFATPAPITVGQPYALAITAAVQVGLKTNGAGTACPDGRLFLYGSSGWEERSTDLVYAVTIA